jgi:hypothetical protein
MKDLLACVFVLIAVSNAQSFIASTDCGQVEGYLNGAVVEFKGKAA